MLYSTTVEHLVLYLLYVFYNKLDEIFKYQLILSWIILTHNSEGKLCVWKIKWEKTWKRRKPRKTMFSDTHTHNIIELLKAKDDESFENSERQLVTCKGSSVRSSADTLEKRQGAGIFKVLEGRAVIRGSYIWQNRPSEAKEQRGHWGSSDDLPQPQGMLQGSWGRGERARDTNSKPQGGIETPGKVNKWVIVKASIILTLVCDSIFYAI